MRGDRRRDVRSTGSDKRGGIAGRDVLENDLETRIAHQQRLQHALDEHLFAVEDVDRRVGYLAMHQQRQPSFLHRRQHRVTLIDVRHPGVGVGRGAGGIELDGVHVRVLDGAPDLVDRRVVGQVQRHQRFERHSRRQGGKDARTIVTGGGDGGHRRAQIGHDDGAGELARRMRQDGRQRFAIAQMEVPVVGTGDGDLHVRSGER